MNEREKMSKEIPMIFSQQSIPKLLDGTKTMTRRIAKNLYFCGDNLPCWPSSGKGIPPYKVGDLIWVRETFGFDPWHYMDGHESILYRASQKIDSDYPIKWKPSIHMPKWAARIFLEITNVRVECLQEITEEDVVKEGFPQPGRNRYLIIDFADAWDELNAKRGHSWESNPWVWVIEFRRVGLGQRNRRA